MARNRELENVEDPVSVAKKRLLIHTVRALTAIPKVNIDGVEHLHKLRNELGDGQTEKVMYVAPIHVNTWNWPIDVQRVINPHLIPGHAHYPEKAVRKLPHRWPTSRKFEQEDNDAIKDELDRLDREGQSQKMSETIDALVFKGLADIYGVTRYPVYQNYLIKLFDNPEAISVALERNNEARSQFIKDLGDGGVGGVYGTGTRDTTGGLTRLDRVDIIWRRSDVDQVVVASQLDTHKIQPRESRGVNKLNPIRNLHVVVFPPQTPEQLQEEARKYEWTDNAIETFGWTKRQDQRFNAADAIMIPVARLNLPVRVQGVDPRGPFQEGKYFVSKRSTRTLR